MIKYFEKETQGKKGFLGLTDLDPSWHGEGAGHTLHLTFGFCLIEFCLFIFVFENKNERT